MSARRTTAARSVRATCGACHGHGTGPTPPTPRPTSRQNPTEDAGVTACVPGGGYPTGAGLLGSQTNVRRVLRPAVFWDSVFLCVLPVLRCVFHAFRHVLRSVTLRSAAFCVPLRSVFPAFCVLLRSGILRSAVFCVPLRSCSAVLVFCYVLGSCVPLRSAFHCTYPPPVSKKVVAKKVFPPTRP
eukprot:gene10223-biopygen720